MLLTPTLPPVTNCHTFSDPLPLERDVLYGRPHSCVFRHHFNYRIVLYCIFVYYTVTILQQLQ